MNMLVQTWIDNTNVTREYIPCQVCGEPTTMRGTKLCNNCWEVMSRLSPFLQCANAIQVVQELLAKAVKGDSK